MKKFSLNRLLNATLQMERRIKVRYFILVLLFLITSTSAFAALDYVEYVSQMRKETGYYVTPSNVLGQTFVTPSACTYIDYIQLEIDRSQWSSSEWLTLTLYTSTERTTTVSRASLNGSTDSYPKFYLKTSVSPNTTYYMELTHGGGDDNIVGWVSVTESNLYSGGCLYMGNATLTPYPNAALYFRVFGYKDDFLVTAYGLPPPPPIAPVLTTAKESELFDWLRDANFNHVEVTGYYNSGSGTARNNAILDLCYARGIMVENSNSDFYTLVNFSDLESTNAQIDAAVARFKDHPANAGFMVKDEPAADKFEKLAYAYNRILSTAPTKIPHVNLLPTYASDTQLFGTSLACVSQTINGVGYYATSTKYGEGLYVKTTNVVGQTFVTPSDCTYIDYITFIIDRSQWSSSEWLTLTLYTSTARTTIVSQASLNGSTDSHPKFYLETSVSPNTTYYMELSHNGGGNKSVGWIAASASDSYSGGSAYQGDTTLTPQSNDLYFQIYTTRPGTICQSVEQLTETAGVGLNVSSTQRLGQTFKTPSSLKRRLQYIELHIDANSWAPIAGINENLTMTIYDSPSRSQVLDSSAAMSISNHGCYPRFYLNADLKPDTTYFFELTHDGGGDNNIGLVYKSASDVYADGTAYVNGSAVGGDFYFRTVYRNPYQDYLNKWVDAVGASNLKLLSFDHYPFVGSSGITTDYFLNLELVRNIGLQNNVRIACYLQSVGIGSGYRIPSENDLRYNVYTNLAYGVKQIQWFNYFIPLAGGSFSGAVIGADGNKTSLYPFVQALNGEVKNLGPTLMRLKSQAVYHNGTRASGTQGLPPDFWWKPNGANDNVIISYFTDPDGRKYILAVNRSLTDSATYYFNVSPAPATVTEISKSTGTEVATNYNSGVLSESFSPGEGKLYALPVGY